jgi:hypothetical protein
MRAKKRYQAARLLNDGDSCVYESYPKQLTTVQELATEQIIAYLLLNSCDRLGYFFNTLQHGEGYRNCQNIEQKGG